MSETTKPIEPEAIPAPDAATEGDQPSLVESAAQLVVNAAESVGYLAFPLYFAANLVRLHESGGLHVFGKLRFNFAQALEDGQPDGGAVAFLVHAVRPENSEDMETHRKSLEERDAGLDYGALRAPAAGKLH